MAYLQQTIKYTNKTQIIKLEAKLNPLCTNGKCKYIGQSHLIENLSYIILSNTEQKGLDFGFKLAISIHKVYLVDIIVKNYRQNVTEFIKVFIHGITTATLKAKKE